VPDFPAEAADLLVACSDVDLDANQRGSNLEELIAVVFGAISGIEVKARNVKSVFENEELDLVMTNRQNDDGLPIVGPFFSVECKNWSRPVGSAELSWFATKLRRSGQTFGVLVAANGVTGKASAMTAAHFEVATALTEGQQVLVLTLEELSRLRSGEQLAQLLIEKLSQLIARREIYIAPEEPAEHETMVWRFRIESRQLRNEGLEIVSDSAEDAASIPDAIALLRTRVNALGESDNNEPYGEPGQPFPEAEHERWVKTNYAAFLAVIDAFEELARSAIARLRAADPGEWPRERLALHLDTSVPRNLRAGPDGLLADHLYEYWHEATQSEYGFHTATLFLLDWALEWRGATKSERWPPPWV
jgi:hypothetical protein